MSEWREVELGDVLSVGHGYAFKGEHFSTGGRTCLVTPGNFYERGGFRDNGAKQKSFDGPVPEEYVLGVGDLVLAMTEQKAGLLGSAALVPDDGKIWLHNQRIGLVQARAAEAGFLLHLFNSPGFRQQVAATATGAKVRHTAPKRVCAVRTRLPGRRAQRRIAAVLSAFDEVIEINERQIELLEGLTRSLYREWFVHFRFPGHEDVEMVDSELGPIPEGWEVARLSQLAAVISRGISPKYDESGQWLVINQRCIRDQRVSKEAARRHGGNVSAKKRAQMGDVLINSTGVGTLGRVAWLGEQQEWTTVDSHVTIVRPDSLELQPWFALTLFSLESSFAAMGTGSTGQTELGRGPIGGVRIMYPPLDLIAQLNEALEPVLAPLETYAAINRQLAHTRDLLLPRLVTGRLDISDLDLGVLTPAEVE